MGYYGYKEYETVAAKKARAAKSAARLQKKNRKLTPVQVTGRKLAKTWWGIAWNNNLENYADFSNRIGRGRAYLTQGAVLDLQIVPGMINGLVQGSRARPYEVQITIAPLPSAILAAIRKACSDNIGSLSDLVEGKFPKQLAELFTAKGKGLFPKPSEISFYCSCPDWASLCKHIAALLYGVGTRLDAEPLLFFTLRQIDITSFVAQSVAQSTEVLLQKADQTSSRTLETKDLGTGDLGALFGVELDDAPSEPTPPAPKKRGRPRKLP